MERNGSKVQRDSVQDGSDLAAKKKKKRFRLQITFPKTQFKVEISMRAQLKS